MARKGSTAAVKAAERKYQREHPKKQYGGVGSSGLREVVKQGKPAYIDKVTGKFVQATGDYEKENPANVRAGYVASKAPMTKEGQRTATEEETKTYIQTGKTVQEQRAEAEAVKKAEVEAQKKAIVEKTQKRSILV